MKSSFNLHFFAVATIQYNLKVNNISTLKCLCNVNMCTHCPTCVLYDVVDLFALSQVIDLETVVPVSHAEQKLGIMGYGK